MIRREKPWKEINGFYIKISFKQVLLMKTEGGRWWYHTNSYETLPSACSARLSFGTHEQHFTGT
jgi:hypothetical protein